MREQFAEKYSINSPRKINWDYSTPGIYFITICTVHHNNFFGKVIDNKIALSKMGTIANQCLVDIPKHFPEIKLLEFVVMPNHVHILLELIWPLFNHVETHHDASLTKIYQSYFHHRIAQKSTQTIPLVIKQYKSAVTKLINPKTVFFAWQERFYDEIISNNNHLEAVKYYIKNNPINWQKDKYYSNSL
jgi:REP element-mobilizing transposase RayT